MCDVNNQELPLIAFKIVINRLEVLRKVIHIVFHGT